MVIEPIYVTENLQLKPIRVFEVHMLTIRIRNMQKLIKITYKRLLNNNDYNIESLLDIKNIGVINNQSDLRKMKKELKSIDKELFEEELKEFLKTYEKGEVK